MGGEGKTEIINACFFYVFVSLSLLNNRFLFTSNMQLLVGMNNVFVCFHSPTLALSITLTPLATLFTVVNWTESKVKVLNMFWPKNMQNIRSHLTSHSIGITHLSVSISLLSPPPRKYILQFLIPLSFILEIMTHSFLRSFYVADSEWEMVEVAVD